MLKSFQSIFKEEYQSIYQAPARINLIGEHIDYNGGKVLPAAISLYIKAWVRKNNTKDVRLYSSLNDHLYIYPITNIEYKEEQGWTNYPLGMIYTLQKHGYNINEGLDIYYTSNIPAGSGLSSSACLLDLTCFILSEEFNLNISKKDIAIFAKESENDFNNLSCGIMDQAAISLGKEKKAILIDTANFSYEYKDIKLNDGYTIVVMSTNKPRKLTESKYNERVNECNIGLKTLQKEYKINNLCELSSNDLPKIKELLDPLIYKRVKHVITENERVYRFIEEMKDDNVYNMGQILNESDESLRCDYEVTGLHLDTLTSVSRNHPACLGSRMTGAGFGGCCIAIVKEKDIKDFTKVVKRKYYEVTNIKPSIMQVEIVDGVKKIA